MLVDPVLTVMLCKRFKSHQRHCIEATAQRKFQLLTALSMVLCLLHSAAIQKLTLECLRWDRNSFRLYRCSNFRTRDVKFPY